MDKEEAKNFLGRLVSIGQPPDSFGILRELKGETALLEMVCGCGKHKCRYEHYLDLLSPLGGSPQEIEAINSLPLAEIS